MRSRKEEGEEDKKDVYDIIFDYITHEGSLRLKKKKKKDECAIRKRAKQYRVQDGQLYRVICRKSKNGMRFVFVLRAKTKILIINGCHRGPEGNYEGCNRTHTKIVQKYLWPGLSKDV